MDNEMILDLENFDFASLIDDEIMSESTSKAATEQSDLSEDDADLYEEDYEDEDEEDLDEEELDEEEPEEEVAVEGAEAFATNFDHLDEDLTFKIGDSTLTKAELTETVKMNEQTKADRAAIGHFVTQFEGERRNVMRIISASMTETQLMKDSILKELNNPRTPSHDKGTLYEELRNVEKREAILNEKQAEYDTVYQRREEQAALLRLSDLNREMTKRLPDWSTKSKEVGEYVGTMGVDASTFIKAANPALLEALIKAMKYDKLYSEKEAAVRNKAAKKNPTSPKSKSSSSVKRLPAKKAQAAKSRIIAGKATSDDNAMMFDLLED